MGLKFLGNTTVTARNPPKLYQAGSFSRLSLYFKTTQSDGLILYVGGEQPVENFQVSISYLFLLCFCKCLDTCVPVHVYSQESVCYSLNGAWCSAWTPHTPRGGWSLAQQPPHKEVHTSSWRLNISCNRICRWQEHLH